jgi:SAM-dependent methyltransferase
MAGKQTEQGDSESRFDMRALAGDRYPPPAWHLEKIEQEMSAPDKTRMMRVVTRMGDQEAPDFSAIDWDRELARFEGIEFPQYYMQPFHSVPGGYLSEAAAVGDRAAMEAIYEQAHPRRSLGVRDALATLVPEEALNIVDLGGGTGDLGAAVARRLPNARVRSIDASPFMIIAGEVQNGGVENLRLEQGFAEQTDLEDASADVVLITLVFHECPNQIKKTILSEVRRVLKPGGHLILSDTPQDDLHDYRGFYEPYKEEWLEYDPVAALEAAGFVDVERQDVAPPLWSVIARNPG